MLEILGKAIIEFLEKELVAAAPEIEKVLLDQLGNLAEMLAEFLGLKAAALAAKEEKPAQLEHE